MMRRLRRAARRVALALALALAPCAAAQAAATTASVAAPAALHPTLTIPHVADQPAGQYYILLLQWSRDVAIGAVTVRVTYLDPPLYLGWLRQDTPAIDQATFERDLAGFPRTLRFRVAYQAAERRALHAKDWKVSLKGPGGAAIAAVAGKRIAPIDLKTGAKGEYWEDDWDYRFDVPAGFLAQARAGFTVSLAGPAGTGTARWDFGAQQRAATDASGYVVYLGGALSGLCVLLLAALYLTRPPRPTVA